MCAHTVRQACYYAVPFTRRRAHVASALSESRETPHHFVNNTVCHLNNNFSLFSHSRVVSTFLPTPPETILLSTLNQSIQEVFKRTKRLGINTCPVKRNQRRATPALFSKCPVNNLVRGNCFTGKYNIFHELYIIRNGLYTSVIT